MRPLVLLSLLLFCCGFTASAQQTPGHDPETVKITRLDTAGNSIDSARFEGLYKTGNYRIEAQIDNGKVSALRLVYLEKAPADTLSGLRRRVAAVPFYFKWKYMHIKVGLAGSDSLDFMFDSGASTTVIDSVAGAKAGISRENRKTINIGGFGGAQKTGLVITDQDLRLGQGLKVRHVNTVMYDNSAFAKMTNIPLDGITGYDILKSCVTGIDFDKRQLYFYKRIADADTTGYTGIPFEFVNDNIPHITISITLTGGERFSGLVMFDMGAALSLMVTADFNKFHNISGKIKDKGTGQGMGVSASFTNETANIKSMQINGHQLGEMPVLLMTDPNAAAKDGYMGILGIDVIKRFNLIMDYAHKKIYLKPNKSFTATVK